MINTVSKFKRLFIMLVMAALCGDYAAGGTGSLSGYNITLSDNIKESGNIIAEIGGAGTSLPEGTHLEWFKSDDGGSSWVRIVPTTFAGGVRNITVNTLGCNVALTDGARKENTVICYKAVLYEGIVSTDITSNVFEQSEYWGELQNGGFEDVVIKSGYDQYRENDFDFIWKNAVEHRLELGRADTPESIELCARAFRTELMNGGTIVGKDPFCPPEGFQFSEINCEAYGALYQTILTTPGTELYWSLWHAARNPAVVYEQCKDMTDSMYIICMCG